MSGQDTVSPIQGKVSEGPGVLSIVSLDTRGSNRIPEGPQSWGHRVGVVSQARTPARGKLGGEVPIPDPLCPFSPQKLRPEEGRALGEQVWGAGCGGSS